MNSLLHRRRLTPRRSKKPRGCKGFLTSGDRRRTKSSKFPVFSLLSRESARETGSQQTASSANELFSLFAVGRRMIDVRACGDDSCSLWQRRRAKISQSAESLLFVSLSIEFGATAKIVNPMDSAIADSRRAKSPGERHSSVAAYAMRGLANSTKRTDAHHWTVSKRLVNTSDTDSGSTIVMLQDLCVSLALICHDCRTDLT